MFTKLTDRTLWFDGDISLTEDQLCERMLSGMSVERCFVEEVTSNIKKYNLIADQPLDVKYCMNELHPSWDIPQEYLNVNILDYCLDKLNRANGSVEYKNQAVSRIKYECQLIENMNMCNLFRSMLYLIDHFTQHNVVWGVGRGSSCASYVLYLFGLHCVDCIKYNIDAKEFFRTT